MEKTAFILQLSPEKTLELITLLASGLLASGHFTREPNEDDEFGEQQVLRCRRIDDGNPKYSTAVVSAAGDILHGLECEVENMINEWEDERIILPEKIQ